MTTTLVVEITCSCSSLPSFQSCFRESERCTPSFGSSCMEACIQVPAAGLLLGNRTRNEEGVEWFDHRVVAGACGRVTCLGSTRCLGVRALLRPCESTNENIELKHLTIVLPRSSASCTHAHNGHPPLTPWPRMFNPRASLSVRSSVRFACLRFVCRAPPRRQHARSLGRVIGLLPRLT